jgi:hypothetical protein
MAAESGSGKPEVEEQDSGDAREKEEERDRGGHYYCSNYKRENAFSARNGVGGFGFGLGRTWVDVWWKRRRRGEEIG